jgi:hypothetical protein
VLADVQQEVQAGNAAALAARVANGELVEVKNAERHESGERDRCYLCGDEVTPFHWQERGVVYCMHLSNRHCIGNPANPRAVHQPEA